MDNVPPYPNGTVQDDPPTSTIYGEATPGPPDPELLVGAFWPGYGILAWFDVEPDAADCIAALQTAGFDNWTTPEEMTAAAPRVVKRKRKTPAENTA